MAAAMRGAVGRLSKLNWRSQSAFNAVLCRNSSREVAEYEEEVQYPEIREKFPPGKWDETKIPPHLAWNRHRKGQELLELEDVRERLETISGDKDRRLYLTRSWDRNPRTLKYKQFITRTHQLNGLPKVYASLNVDEEYEKFKPLLQNVLLQENDYFYDYEIEHKKCKPDAGPSTRARKLLGSLVNIALAACSQNSEHLLRSQVDSNVRVESYWEVAFDNSSWISPTWMQFKGETAHHIRTERPLPEFLPLEDDICHSGEYPDMKYEPQQLAQKHIHERPFSVSGHWIGDPCEFTHLSCQNLATYYQNYLSTYAEYPDILEEFWLQCGLMTSFGSCLAQAHNQGFNRYQNVTYPFTTQTAVLEDNTIQFFAYQMNTFHLWLDKRDNPVTNILWVGEKQRLFDVIENGQVKGMNDDAFKQLLKCFLLAPVDRGYDLRPNVSSEKTPLSKKQYFNNVDEPVFEVPKIGRWQYPRKSLYF